MSKLIKIIKEEKQMENFAGILVGAFLALIIGLISGVFVWPW